MSRPLCTIGADLLALEAALDARADAPPGADRDADADAAFAAWAATLAGEEAAKLDAYVLLIRQAEATADAAKAEAARMAAVQRAETAKADDLRDRLKRHLEATKRTKVRTAAGRTIGVRKNGGRPGVEYDPDLFPDHLPEQFRESVFVVNKDAVRAALQGGEVLDFARLKEAGTSLTIR